MPRNGQGIYTPPSPENPVYPGTLIEAEWANATMNDMADALTGSVTRDGTGTMTGPLTLPSAPPTDPRYAANKAYVDSFMAYAVGMPVGAVFPMASSAIPSSGYLICDGTAVSRTTYADLFAAIGSTYGAGDGVSTFNVPDLRDWFVRGKSPTRAVGSQQLDSFATHSHGVTDPTHSHPITDPGHLHIQNPHNHPVTDPGHVHDYTRTNIIAGNTAGSNGNNNNQSTVQTASKVTGLTVDNATATNQAAVTGILGTNAAATGISTVATGGTETTPKNIAMNYWIKAVNDSAGATPFTGITSSDTQMISIDYTNPVVPELDIHSNVAFGVLKLDANGKVPTAQIGTGIQNLIGTWDAAPGIVPPTTGRLNGDTYIIGTQGTLTVYDPATLTLVAQLCAVGNELCYIDVAGQPVGWYRLNDLINGLDVIITPSGGLSATNAQDAIAELEAEKLAKAGGAMTGTLQILQGQLEVRLDSATVVETVRLSNGQNTSSNGSKISWFNAGTAFEGASVSGNRSGAGLEHELAFSTSASFTTTAATEKMRISGTGVITLGGLSTAPALSVIPVANQNNQVQIYGGQTSISEPRVSATAGNLVIQSAGALQLCTGLQTPPQVLILDTPSVTRYITLTGSNGGNPTIGTSAGALQLSPSTVAMSTAQVGGFLGVNKELVINADAAGIPAISFAVNATLAGYLSSTASGMTITTAAAIPIDLKTNQETQVRVTHTAGANRIITLTGSNGGNPTIGTSAGSLTIAPAGLPSCVLSANASAVNYTEIVGVASGSGTLMRAGGSDTDISMLISPKGAGSLHLYGQGVPQVIVTATASANRYITLTGSNGGTPVIGTSAGNLYITPAGGTVEINGGTATAQVVRSLTTGTSGLFLGNATSGIRGHFQADDSGNAYLSAYGTGATFFYTGGGVSAQMAVTHTAGANRYITLTGSNGGNPTIGTSAGDLNLESASNVIRIRSTANPAALAFQINATEYGRISISNLAEFSFNTGAANTQLKITQTGDGSRWVNITGALVSGNPKISASAGSLDIGSPVAFTAQTVGTTVGAAGGASALPATPLGYLTTSINGVACKVPYYTS